MKVAVELSLYPLTPNYEPVIVDFIKRLKESDIQVATNPLSTQLSGDYDAVMALLTDAMRPTLAGDAACSFVMKILNVAIEPGQEVEI